MIDDFDHLFVRVAAESALDERVARRRVERVAEQVEHDLLKLVGIGAQLRRCAANDTDRDASASRFELEQLDHAAHERLRIDWGAHWRGATGDREHLGHDTGDALGLLHDQDGTSPGRVGVFRVLGERAGAPLEHLQR